MTLPKAIFFDWDGTLVDSLGFVRMAHNHVRGHFGLTPWSEGEFTKHMKHSSRVVYPQVYGERHQEAMDRLIAFSKENYDKHVTVFDGTVDLLEELHHAGIPMGVVSNMRHAALVDQVSLFGFQKYFKVVGGAGYATIDKPSAEPLLKALDETGFVPGPDIYYVGDTETDLLCARNAGCKAVFFHHGNHDNPLIQQYKPHISNTNCREFIKTLFPPGNCHRVNV